MIEVKHVTKKYGNFTAVDDINFTIKNDEIVGFLGPNGAGKSTTMNMITGYIEPTSGKIIVNDYDISKDPKKVKRQIGYMPESTPLYNDLTVREFVNYMADLKYVKRKEKVDKVLKDVGLTDVQKKLIRNLSRGYKQRVSMAGALIGDPKVLILDEPTVGLDPKQITEIRDLIRKLGKNHTVILSSHILSEVSQICEKVIIINKGKVLAVDTPSNLEEKFEEENRIFVTVEDEKNKIDKVAKKIKNLKSIEFIKNKNDGTKQYELIADKSTDLRKEIFNLFPKNDINILELKKSEITLEDAFLKLISQKENEAEEKKKKEEEKKAKREEELSKMSKKDRKEAIKQDKKDLKQKEKEEFNKQWEENKKREKEEKERVKEVKKKIKEEKTAEKVQNKTEKAEKKVEKAKQNLEKVKTDTQKKVFKENKMKEKVMQNNENNKNNNSKKKTNKKSKNKGGKK